MTEQLFISRPWTTAGLFTAGIEGPACDADGNLYAVQFERDGTIGKVSADSQVGLFVELPQGSRGNGIRFNRTGEMLIADHRKHNVLKVDMQTQEISVLAHSDEMNQPNDLAITANDIIFASDPRWGRKNGKLWRIMPDGEISCLEEDMGTTNGIEVSTDETKLYVNESVQRKIWMYDLDAASGDLANKRLLVEFDDFGMDGMRCDIEGKIYVTRYNKGTVAIVSPEGKVLREVELFGKKCTNIAFGGEDGRTCYVTVADHGYIEMFRSDTPGRSWQLLQG